MSTPEVVRSHTRFVAALVFLEDERKYNTQAKYVLSTQRRAGSLLVRPDTGHAAERQYNLWRSKHSRDQNVVKQTIKALQRYWLRLHYNPMAPIHGELRCLQIGAIALATT